MATVTVKVNLPKLPNLDIDFSQEFRKSAELIAAEIRGNITRGTTVDERGPLPANSPSVAAAKKIRVGHSRPLIADHRKLVSKESYVIEAIRKNVVLLRLSNAVHPGGGISIARLGAIHNNGEGQKKREFWGVSPTAFKRIRSFIADKIKEILKK